MKEIFFAIFVLATTIVPIETTRIEKNDNEISFLEQQQKQKQKQMRPFSTTENRHSDVRDGDWNDLCVCDCDCGLCHEDLRVKANVSLYIALFAILAYVVTTTCLCFKLKTISTTDKAISSEKNVKR